MSFAGGASPYSALNMLGNESEWVNDWYVFNAYLRNHESNPQRPPHGKRKVFRGGSCRIEYDLLRLSYRDVEFEPPPPHRDPWLGFRCAVSTDALSKLE